MRAHEPNLHQASQLVKDLCHHRAICLSPAVARSEPAHACHWRYLRSRTCLLALVLPTMTRTR